MPDIISRHEALALNRKRFYTGKPCKRQHDSERFTINGACVACVNPKMAPALMPPALESYVLPNKRVVHLITQDEARNRGWKVFFTGLPCEEGHLTERNVTCGRCIDCLHPRKYGIDASTGWWPFQPAPPLRVPPGTPQEFRARLAEKLQAEIPRLVKEIEAETGKAIPVAVYETLDIHEVLHKHVGGLWQGLKLYWPVGAGAREAEHIDPRVQPSDVPWVSLDGKWVGLITGQPSIPVYYARPYDPEEGQRRSQTAALEASQKISTFVHRDASLSDEQWAAYLKNRE